MPNPIHPPLSTWFAKWWRKPEESLRSAVDRLATQANVGEKTIRRALSGSPLWPRTALRLAAVDPARLDPGKLALGRLAPGEKRAA